MTLNEIYIAQEAVSNIARTFCVTEEDVIKALIGTVFDEEDGNQLIESLR